MQQAQEQAQQRNTDADAPVLLVLQAPIQAGSGPASGSSFLASEGLLPGQGSSVPSFSLLVFLSLGCQVRCALGRGGWCRWPGLQRLQGVEHLLGCDILGKFRDSGSWPVSIPRCVAIAMVKASSLVISCSASRLICKSRSARFSAWAVIRFCVIRIKVDRKMASTEATIASATKVGSKWAAARQTGWR